MYISNNDTIMRTRYFGILFFLLVLAMGSNAQKFEDLAKTPPVCWNSWNKFGCNISGKLITEMADEMVSNGMLEAGYSYLVIDDCWQIGRDSLGNIK